jgi:thioesterase domain-containing protein
MNLDPDIPVYGLQARGIATPAALPRSLTEMVDDYLEVITAVQPAGPYRLLGWSLGGTVAQAMAATLQRAGEEVSRLVLLDGYPAMTWAADDEPGSAESYRDLLIAVLRDFGVDVDNPWAEGASTDELLKLASGHLGADTILDQDVLSAIVRAAERSVWVARQEQPRVFTGPVTSFTAEYSLDVGVRPVTLWGEHLTGPIDDHLVPSIHVQMASPQASSRVAEVLRTRL